jgi:hypothetical protein
MSSLDKRINRRLPVSLFVNRQFDETRQNLCMSLDLSRGGMTIVSLSRDGQASLGHHAWLRFWLPGQERPIQALGEVVHRQHDDALLLERTGIRFKFLFPDQQRMLESYLGECTAAA